MNRPSQRATPDDPRYQAALARDPQADGTFWLGVHSTGIYCLPSCVARKPLARNVEFFASAEAAREAGFRPCKVCRPDRFARSGDQDIARFDAVTHVARERLHALPDLRTWAREAALSVSSLTALLHAHAHLTPAAWLRRQRVARAADALRREETSVLAAADAAGFASTSAFYRQFSTLMAMPPAAYRDLLASAQGRLAFPRGFDPWLARRVAGRDTTETSERVSADGRRIDKAIRTPTAILTLSLALEQDHAHLAVQSDAPLGPTDVAAAHAAALATLGLGTTAVTDFRRRAGAEPAVARWIAGIPVVALPRTPTVFEALVWAVLGQQVTVAFATALRAAVVRMAGPAAPLGLVAHPTPADIASLDVASLVAVRCSAAKARTLIGAAQRIVEGSLPVETFPQRSARWAERLLLEVPGIGPWTARYTLMRGAGFDDLVPIGDTALATVLHRMQGGSGRRRERQSPEDTDRGMAIFRPHRSVATAHAWARHALGAS